MNNLDYNLKLERLILQELKLYQQEQLLNEGTVSNLVDSIRLFPKLFANRFGYPGRKSAEMFRNIKLISIDPLDKLLKNPKNKKYRGDSGAQKLFVDADRILKKMQFTGLARQLFDQYRLFAMHQRQAASRIDDAFFKYNVEELESISKQLLNDLENIRKIGFQFTEDFQQVLIGMRAGATSGAPQSIRRASAQAARGRIVKPGAASKAADDLTPDDFQAIEPDLEVLFRILANFGREIQKETSDINKFFNLKSKAGRRNLFNFYFRQAGKSGGVTPPIKAALGMPAKQLRLRPEDREQLRRIIEFRKQFINAKPGGKPAAAAAKDAGETVVQATGKQAAKKTSKGGVKVGKFVLGVGTLSAIVYVAAWALGWFVEEAEETVKDIKNQADAIFADDGLSAGDKLERILKLYEESAGNTIKDSIEALKEAGVEDEAILEITRGILDQVINKVPSLLKNVKKIEDLRQILTDEDIFDPQQMILATYTNAFKAYEIKSFGGAGGLETQQEIEARYKTFYGRCFTNDLFYALEKGEVNKSEVEKRVQSSLVRLLDRFRQAEGEQVQALLNGLWGGAMKGAQKGVEQYSSLLTANRMYTIYKEQIGKIKEDPKYKSAISNIVKSTYKDITKQSLKSEDVDFRDHILAAQLSLPYKEVYINKFAKSELAKNLGDIKTDISPEDFAMLFKSREQLEAFKSNKSRKPVYNRLKKLREDKLLPLINSILIPLGFTPEDYKTLGLYTAKGANMPDAAKEKLKAVAGEEPYLESNNLEDALKELGSAEFAKMVYNALNGAEDVDDLTENDIYLTLGFATVLIPFTNRIAYALLKYDRNISDKDDKEAARVAAAAQAEKLQKEAQKRQIILIKEIIESLSDKVALEFFNNQFSTINRYNSTIKSIYLEKIVEFGDETPHINVRGGG